MARIAASVKIILFALAIVIFAVVTYSGYEYHKLTLQSAKALRVRAELEPGFQAKLEQYQRELAIGTSRSEVKRYLNSRNISYTESPQQIMVVLGDEPDVFPCDSWRVYASLKFLARGESLEFRTGKQVEPNAPDRLASVSLGRIGHCL